ncbi:MAG: SAM-dependent methyltransferase [Pseudomonadales bacterium]|jgi:methyltransferase (TIGR00027 family)|nr:SAM-dependent methyltransferase [Pseudomonadales bacterium]
MIPDRPSRTAEGAALLRALHAFVDDAPLLFEDHVVRDLLSMPARLALRPLPLPMKLGLRRRERLRPTRAALRGQIVLRSRYAEDALDAALAAGVDQILILAAGLDTTALRRPTRLAKATLWEIDHPATQAWKRRRLGGRGEGRIRFVPVVFGEQDLTEALLAAGVDPARPVFVNWLGCTYYLTPEAMSGTLRSLSAFDAPGSEVVVDYWTDTAVPDLPSRLLLGGARVALAVQQEPLLGMLSPRAFHRLAAAAGWRVVEDLDAAAQRARWLAGRRDTLSVPGFAHLARLQPARESPT